MYPGKAMSLNSSHVYQMTVPIYITENKSLPQGQLKFNPKTDLHANLKLFSYDAFCHFVRFVL